MNKIVIKILQSSVVTQTVVGELQLQISYSLVYVPKLWKLVASRQSYCNNNQQLTLVVATRYWAGRLITSAFLQERIFSLVATQSCCNQHTGTLFMKTHWMNNSRVVAVIYGILYYDGQWSRSGCWTEARRKACELRVTAPCSRQRTNTQQAELLLRRQPTLYVLVHIKQKIMFCVYMPDSRVEYTQLEGTVCHQPGFTVGLTLFPTDVPWSVAERRGIYDAWRKTATKNRSNSPAPSRLYLLANTLLPLQGKLNRVCIQ